MSTPQPPRDEESVFAHIGRACQNAATKCFGCVQTSDEKAKIHYKLYQIEARKKAFGVAYLNGVKEKASDEKLKTLVDSAEAGIADFEKEIEVLQNEIDRVNNVTKSKLVGGAPATGGTTTAMDSATAPQPTPTAVDSATTTQPTPAISDPPIAPPKEESSMVLSATAPPKMEETKEPKMEETKGDALVVPTTENALDEVDLGAPEVTTASTAPVATS